MPFVMSRGADFHAYIFYHPFLESKGYFWKGWTVLCIKLQESFFKIIFFPPILGSGKVFHSPFDHRHYQQSESPRLGQTGARHTWHGTFSLSQSGQTSFLSILLRYMLNSSTVPVCRSLIASTWSPLWKRHWDWGWPVQPLTLKHHTTHNTHTCFYSQVVYFVTIPHTVQSACQSSG